MQQELQNWTGGPKDQCKLIGIKSRFALIDRKAQEQKKHGNFRNFENFKGKKRQNSPLCSISDLIIVGQVP